MEGKVKRKMQNVDFSSVDEFLDFLPNDELEIVQFLREIVFDCIPNCQEKLAYNVPFYRKHSNICFIWPSSVMWGNKKHEGVRFGFTSGYLLNDEMGFLERGNRKYVFWKDFFKLSDIDVPLLKTYLFDALAIDEEKAKKKKAPRK